MHKVTYAFLSIVLTTAIIWYGCENLLPSEEKDTKPSKPSLVRPQQNATVAAGDVILEWNCQDEDGDMLIYSLYFGTDNPPPLLLTGLTTTSFTMTDLAEAQTYYWYIAVQDEDDYLVQGDLWTFETGGNHAPSTPHTPSPQDGAVDVQVEMAFSWECEDEDGDTLSYRIQVDAGDDGTFDFEVEPLSEPQYTPEQTLQYDTEYRWVVTAYDTLGGVNSAEWRFHTVGYQAGQMVSAVSNFAIFGDPNGNYPSGEWPAGSGSYYLWEGRTWIGAVFEHGIPHRADTTWVVDTLVSAADYGDYEFQPTPPSAGDPRPEQSWEILGDGVWQMNTVFDDTTIIRGHVPMGLKVEETVTAFPADGALGSIFLVEQTITKLPFVYPNVRTGLHDFYATYVFDCDVAAGPNGADHANGGSRDDLVGYDPDFQIGYMYDGDDPDTPEDDTGEGGTATGYFGIALVDAPQPVMASQWWNWEEDPGSDPEEYLFMSGTHPAADGPFRSPPDVPFDYRVTISSGPYQLNEGETLRIVFAFGVGEGLDGLRASVGAMREWYAQNH